MEENKKTTKSKLRAYLPIIVLGIVLVASAIGLGIAAINKSKNETAEEVTFNSEFMTLEEIEALEDYVEDLTEEEIATLKEAAKNGVQDELTLRLLLLLDDEIEIKVSNNMELIVGMKVNGQKTLTGDATLKMFLASEKNTMEDAVLIVSRGNTLDMEGLVIDGNGVCHAILVQEGATLNYNKGTIQYASSYGIYNQGTTYVNGGTLTKCMSAAIGVKSGGKTYVTGGTIKDNYKNHIWSAANSIVEVTGGVFDHSYEHGIYNRGTLTMTGGTIKNSNSANACAVANFGKAYIDGGDDYIEISNCVTGFFSEDDNMEVNMVYGHDIVKNFLRIKEGKGKVTNCKVENTGTYAVRVGGEATIENIYAENIGTHGIYISPGKATVKNVEVKNAKEYGFVNVGGEVTATNIKITGAGTSAFINYDSTLNGKGEKGLLTLKDCVATDCKSNLLVRGGTSVKVSDCVFNKTVRTNVHMTEGTAELTNVKLLGASDKDCSIVSIRKDAKATFTNVEMAYGNRGISLAGQITVNGGSIHDNEGELAGNAVRTEDNAVYKLDGVKIYNNRNTSETMAGGVGFMAKGSHGTIVNCEITNNSSIRTVGGIYAEKAELNIRDTVFKNNYTSGAEGKGGAILLEKSKSIIRGCTFEENKTGTAYQNVGGAIYSKAGSDLQIIDCDFNKNVSGRGGAIANVGALTMKEGTTFTNNTCTEGGAAVYNGGNGIVTDNGSTYEKNTLTEVHAGGAIRNDGTNTQYIFRNVVLKENSAKGDGGAIYNTGTLEATNGCKFIGNKGRQGGALYNKGTVTLDNAIFDETSYDGNDGSCIYNFAKAKLNVKKVEMKNIGTGKDNHAILNNGGTITAVKNAKQTLKINNVAGHGLVNMGSGTTKLTGVSIKDVTGADRYGVYSENGSVTLTDISIKNVTKDAVYVKGGTANIEDATIENITRAAITATETTDDGSNVTATGEVTLKNVTVKLPKDAQDGARSAQYGIYCVRGKVNIDNVDIANTGSTGDDHAVLNIGGTLQSVEGAEKSITVIDSTGHGIANTGNGTMTLSGVTVENVVKKGISSDSGTVTVENVAIKKADDGIYLKHAEATGTLTVKGAKIENVNRGIAVAQGVVSVEDVTVKKSTEEGAKIHTYGIFVYSENSTAELKKVTVEDAATAGVCAEGGTVLADTLVIKRGAKAIYNKAGVIGTEEKPVTGVSVEKSSGHGVHNEKGTLYMDGVTIANDIANSKKGIAIQGGTVTVKNAEISGTKDAAVYVGEKDKVTANVTLYDATITKFDSKAIELGNGTLTLLGQGVTVTPNAYKGGTAIVAKGAGGSDDMVKTVAKGIHVTPDSTGETWFVNDAGKLTKYAIKNGNKSYINLSDAVTEATDNDTLILMENVSVSGTIEFTKSLTITSTKAVEISGTIEGGHMFDVLSGNTLKIKGASETAKITVKKDTTKNVINNSGTVELDYVIIEGGRIALYNLGGTINADELQIKSTSDKGVVAEGGTVTLKNTLINKPGAAGIMSYNTAPIINLDNVTVSGATGFGVNHKLGTLNITADEVNNPKNTSNNGLTVDGAKSHGIYVEGGKIVAEEVTVCNLTATNGRGVDLRGGSDTTIVGLTVYNTSQQGVYISANKTKANISDFEIYNTTGEAFLVKSTATNGVLIVKNGEIRTSKTGLWAEAISSITATVENVDIYPLNNDQDLAKLYNINSAITNATITDVNVHNSPKS